MGPANAQRLTQALSSRKRGTLPHRQAPRRGHLLRQTHE